MQTLRNFLRSALGIGLLALLPHANAVPVDLELSLVIDVSPSVNNTEFNLQMDGYTAAFQDAGIQAAIAALPGGIAVNAIFFSQNAVEKISWTHLTDAVSANTFASLFGTLSRIPPVNNGTDIAEGYNLAIASFGANGFEGTRQTIDISGDGPQNLNGGCPGLGDGLAPACTNQTSAARAAAELAGITVNGIVIGPNDPLFGPGGGVAYYQNQIITSGGFAVAATDFAEFGPAVRDKIFREIVVDVPEPSTLALMFLGLLGLAFARRA